MKNDHRHTINQVSTYTGLPSYIIRTWEARYSAITPLRSNSNWRLFCDKDIKRLQLLNRAVEIGHSISQVASLSHEDLTGIVRSDLFQSRHHTVDDDQRGYAERHADDGGQSNVTRAEIPPGEQQFVHGQSFGVSQ